MQKFKEQLKRFFGSYGYLIAAAIIPAAVMYLLYAIGKEVHPFGNGCVLVLDLNGQYVYFYEALRNAVLGDRSLLYSFSRSMGGEFFGIYAYYIASPFSYIVCLFKQEHMLEALLTIFILKVSLCSTTMAFYLHKTAEYEDRRFLGSKLFRSGDKINKMSIIGFSILYALCSYCIVQQHNSMWIDAVIWLPIVTYGIEQVVKYGKYKIFVFFLALTILSNFYIGYMVCIYVAIYFFYYLFGQKKDNFNNPTNEKSHVLRSFIRIGTWSVLAVSIAAVIILTAYTSLQFGKNTFSTPNWTVSAKFPIWELLIKLYPSSYDTVRPSGLPFIYCGVLTLILVPLYFVSKRRGAREKAASAIFIAVFVASFFISVIDLVWHGFQKPNWLNYRYSFMLCFFLIVLAFKAFRDLKFIARKAAFISALSFGLLVILLEVLAKDLVVSLGQKSGEPIVDGLSTVWLTLGCLVVYVIILSFIRGSKNKELLAAIMVGFICIEAFFSGLCDMTDLDYDVVYSKYDSYNNFLAEWRPMVNTVLENDDSFYRMEKTYSRKSNDNMALNIRGLTNSTSTLNADTITLIRALGYYAQSHESMYCYGNPVNDSLLGIKYIITDADRTHYYGNPIYDSDDLGNDDYVVYLNQYALSLAYAADDDLKGYNISCSVSPFERLNLLVTALLGADEKVEVFKPCVQVGQQTDNIKVNADGSPVVSSKHYKYEETDKSLQGKVTFTYEVPYTENIEASEVNRIIADFLGSKYGLTVTSSDDEPETISEDEIYLKSYLLNFEYSRTDGGYEFTTFKTKPNSNHATVQKAISEWADARAAYLKANALCPEDGLTNLCVTQRGQYYIVSMMPAEMTDAAIENVEDGINQTEIYAYFPTSYMRKVKVKMDSNTQVTFGDGKDRRIIQLGKPTSSTVNITVTLDNDNGQFYIDQSTPECVYYVDNEVLEDVFARLAEHQFIITDYTEDDFHGTMNTAKDSQFVFTSLPYDSGWQIYVDGKKVETESAVKLGVDEYDNDGNLTKKTNNALVAFTIPTAGDHEIRIQYMPKCYVVGMTVTVTGAVIFLALFIFGKQLRKIKIIRWLYCTNPQDEIIYTEPSDIPESGDAGNTPKHEIPAEIPKQSEDKGK